MAPQDALELPLPLASSAEESRSRSGRAQRRSANDNQRLALVRHEDAGAEPRAHDPQAARLRSALPADAVAVIEPHRRGWRLRFLPRRPASVDPLTGWTGSEETLSQVELHFDSREQAIRYAQRHGLAFEERAPAAAGKPVTAGHQCEAPLWLCCWPTGPHALCCGRYPVLQAKSSGSI